MSQTRVPNLNNRLAMEAQTRPGFVARNRTMLYVVAAFLVGTGALFGGDGQHTFLSAFIAGLGAGVAFTTARLSRR